MHAPHFQDSTPVVPNLQPNMKFFCVLQPNEKHEGDVMSFSVSPVERTLYSETRFFFFGVNAFPLT